MSEQKVQYTATAGTLTPAEIAALWLHDFPHGRSGTGDALTLAGEVVRLTAEVERLTAEVERLTAEVENMQSEAYSEWRKWA